MVLSYYVSKRLAAIIGSSLFSGECRPQLGLFSSAISVTLREPSRQRAKTLAQRPQRAQTVRKGPCGVGEPVDMAIPTIKSRNQLSARQLRNEMLLCNSDDGKSEQHVRD